jgi:D-glycerate 3-kinase
MDLALARRGPAWAALNRLGVEDEAAWRDVLGWLDTHVPEGPRREERITWLLAPAALWVRHHLSRSPRRPLVVGVSAPQGAGKTTLTGLLVQLLEDVLHAPALAISIDDFYLPREAQLHLAAAHPGNPYLEHRGYPGTHDVALGARVLESLRRGEDVDVPRYDKSAHGGRGDRSRNVTAVRGRRDVVFLEGWLLGFQPVAAVSEAHLAEPNARLREYEAWHRQLDVLLALGMQEPTQVVQWRVEAEARMRAAGRAGLSDAEAEDYVRRFLPAYATWGPTVTRGRWQGDALLALTLDGDRVPVETRHV